jgi:hypothetical protein
VRSCGRQSSRHGHCRRTNTAAVATLPLSLLPSCPKAATSTAVTFVFIIIIITTAAITMLLLFCHRRHTAVNTLPQCCQIGQSLKSRSNSLALEKPPMAFHVLQLSPVTTNWHAPPFHNPKATEMFETARFPQLHAKPPNEQKQFSAVP